MCYPRSDFESEKYPMKNYQNFNNVYKKVEA